MEDGSVEFDGVGLLLVMLLGFEVVEFALELVGF